MLDLVNLSPFHARSILVQAGTFGEHSFTTVKHGAQTTAVNGKFFEVHLAPGAGVTLEAGIKRYANMPSYAFPWHGDRIPVR